MRIEYLFDSFKSVMGLEIKISGYCLVAALHIVGLVLLHKAKLQIQNQKIILMNLSVSEMLFCLFESFYFLNELVWSSETLKYVIVGITSISFLNVRFAMFHFIIDRFLDIWLNLKYPLYFSKKILTIIIITQWILSFILVVVMITLLNFKVIGWYTVQIVRLSMDIIIVIAALITFPYLFVKVKNAIHLNVGQERKQNRIFIALLKLKVPMLMVITYIAFNTTYSIFVFTWSYSGKSSFTFEILDICGWGSDVFIYVFLQKRVRRLLLSSCLKENRNQVGDTHTSSVR